MTRTIEGAAWSWRTACLSAVVCLVVGCGGSVHTLRAERPEIVLQWPYQPNRAKVTYVHSLTGVAVERNVRTRLKSIVFGREKSDRNSFLLPVAVAMGGDGRIAVADMGRKCVHLYIPEGQRYLRLYGSEEHKVISPVAVVFDDEMTLYLSDSAGKVFAFGPEGEFLYVLQQAGKVPLERPTGLAYSPTRKWLYVVDTIANRIHAFGTQGDLALSFGERGEQEGQFNFPTHIARSASGDLYVTDSLNFRVAMFDELGRPLGSFGHHGDGSGDMAMPKGLAVDRDGVIYVVDSVFDNVQLFNREGEFLLTLGRRGVDFGEFWLPSGMFIDDDNRLYVCDTYNRRIQVFRITERYADDAS